MILLSEAAEEDVFYKKRVLKTLETSEAWSLQLYLKKGFEFCEIFKNIF